MTLVCFALPFESAVFRKKITTEMQVDVLHTGMGADAAEVLKASIERMRPARVVSSGFTGALDPTLHVGDLFVARNFSSASWCESLVGRYPNVSVGTLATAVHVVDTPLMKSELRQTTGAGAVDMESESLFRVANEAGLPMLTVRSISDDAMSDLVVPSSLLHTAAVNGAVGTARLLAWVLAHPEKWGAFSKFVADSKKAQRSLEQLCPLLQELLVESRGRKSPVM